MQETERAKFAFFVRHVYNHRPINRSSVTFGIKSQNTYSLKNRHLLTRWRRSCRRERNHPQTKIKIQTKIRKMTTRKNPNS